MVNLWYHKRIALLFENLEEPMKHMFFGAYLLVSVSVLAESPLVTGQTVPEEPPALLSNTEQTGASTAQQPQSPNPADPIMDKVMQRINESNSVKPARMACKKVKIITDLDGAKFITDPGGQQHPDPKTVRVKRIEVYQVYGVGPTADIPAPHMVQKLVKVKENANQDSRENNERDASEDCARCRDAHGKEEPLGTDLNDPAFVPRYSYTLLESGDESQAIKLTPKTGLPMDTDEDKIYNRVEGTAYVDAKRGFIRLFTGSVTKQFRELVVLMQRFDIVIEQGVIDNLIFTQQITITVRYKVGYSFLSSKTFERHRITFKDFVVLPAPVVPASPPPVTK